MTKRRHRMLGAVVGAGILVSSAFILFGRWANSPVSTVGTALPVKAVEGESTQVGNVQFSTNQFTTSIPSNLQKKSLSEQQQGSILVQVLFSGASGAPGSRVADQLAMTAGLLPVDGLDGLSAIMMRSRTPNVYEAKDYDWLPQGARAFSRDGSESEISVFFADGQRYAAVVATSSPDRRPVFESMLQTVTETWQWN